MSKTKDKAGRLQEWILIEAYKNGQARRTGERTTGDFGAEESERYFIHRHDIYQRYFKLSIEAFLRGEETGGATRRHIKLRLKSTAILCESVRHLLKDGLIQFPQRGSANMSQADLLRLHANFIFLTQAGIRKAASLLAGFQDPPGPDKPDWRWAQQPV